MASPTEIAVIPIGEDVAASPEAARDFFVGKEPLRLGQPWLEKNEPGFLPGSVWVGWTPSDLVVWAVMGDADIHNAATGLNQDTWKLGDVFEVFLRAEREEPYFEFHVTPENNRLQLRIPGADWFRRFVAGEERFDEAKLPGEVFASQTLVEKNDDRWSVLARIPLATIGGTPGGALQFSFCRYDYTRGRDLPILSSTSGYSVPVSFHQQSAWCTLRLAEG